MKDVVINSLRLICCLQGVRERCFDKQFEIDMLSTGCA